MKNRLQILFAPALSLVIWFISYCGMMICYMTAQIGGFILYPIFMFINSWPLILIKAIDSDLHGQLLHPNDDWSNTYVRGQIVCLIGWLIISPIVFLGYKVFKDRREQKQAES